MNAKHEKRNDQAAIKKRWIKSMILEAFMIIFSIYAAIEESLDDIENKYIFDIGPGSLIPTLLFYTLLFAMPFVAIKLGFLISRVAVRVFLIYAKRSKRVFKVGFARFEEERVATSRRYLLSLLFAAMLCTNLYIMIIKSNYLLGWLSETGILDSIGEDGSLRAFVYLPWYWVPVTITMMVFAIVYAILDSGLVFLRKNYEHGRFADSERVGDTFYNIVKGYASISVIISWIQILQTDLGRELSLILFPIMMIVIMIPFFATIELAKQKNRRKIFKQVSKYFEPELVDLDFSYQPVREFSDMDGIQDRDPKIIP